MLNNEPIHLRKTALSITEHCTLKCKLCIAFVPYIKNPQELSFGDFKSIVDRYFTLVASVGTFCITGGEPLLHEGGLVLMLDYLSRYLSQIRETIDLTTNGTLEMSDEVLDFYKRHADRTRVIISDYGILSPKVDKLVESLRSIGVPVRTEHFHGDELLYGGWVDLRDNSQKHHTKEEIDKQSQSCFFKNKQEYTIRGRKLYHCARSYWRMLQGIIPDNKYEYIDFMDELTPVEEQKQILRSMIERTSFSSCAYCSGLVNDTQRYVPAQQLSSEEQSRAIELLEGCNTK